MLRNKYSRDEWWKQAIDREKKKEKLLLPEYPNDEWRIHAASKFTVTSKSQARADIPGFETLENIRDETRWEISRSPRGTRRGEWTKEEKGSLTRDKLVKGGALVRWFPASMLIARRAARGGEEKRLGQRAVGEDGGKSISQLRSSLIK